MYQKLISLFVIVMFMAGITGCASIPEEHKGAATGAGIGAAAGAAAGALAGSKGAKTEMAVLGGFLGALSGGLIGHYAYDEQQSKEATSKRYKYNPSKGLMLRIESASAVPAKVSPGESVDIRMTYAVLGAAPGKELHVTETREIKFKGEIYSKPKVQITRTDGTYFSRLPVTLPPDAKKGKYTVIVTVQTKNISNSKETAFFVK